MFLQNKSRKYLFFIVSYFFIIIAAFIGYTVMLQQRMALSKLYESGETLTSEEIDFYVLLIDRTIFFESLFIFLFLLMSVYYFAKNRKDRSNKGNVKEYISLQLSILVIVAAVCFIFSFTTDVHVVDLLMILLGPAVIFVLLLVYMSIGLKRKVNKLEKE